MSAFDSGGFHERSKVRTELSQSAIGPAETRASGAPQVVHEHAMAKHQIGKGSAPGSVVVGQSVNQDEGLAAPDLEPGDLDVVTRRAHSHSASCGSLCQGRTGEALRDDGSSPATCVEPAPAL